jgi:hypothetical protein
MKTNPNFEIRVPKQNRNQMANTPHDPIAPESEMAFDLYLPIEPSVQS